MRKIDDIIYCDKKTECKWKCFALDYQGYGHGKLQDYQGEWMEWHKRECGGKLIQAKIVFLPDKEVKENK